VRSILLFSALLMFSCVGPSRPEKGKLISQLETNNQVFKIRISEYDEKGAYLTGAYYVFESAALDSDNWIPIMTFRHDDQPGIPKDQVRFVDQQIAYAYMGWMSAVTKDGGTSWTVWDAKKDLPDWKCCNYGLIDDLKIALEGEGVMKLRPIHQRPGEIPELRTKDYGQHWNVQEGTPK